MACVEQFNKMSMQLVTVQCRVLLLLGYIQMLILVSRIVFRLLLPALVAVRFSSSQELVCSDRVAMVV
jgi:hypothetical protein